MILKVIRRPLDGNSQDRISYYGCRDVYVFPVEDSSSDFRINVVTSGELFDHTETLTYDADEPGLGVYLLNDNGKTIDTIRARD